MTTKQRKPTVARTDDAPELMRWPICSECDHARLAPPDTPGASPPGRAQWVNSVGQSVCRCHGDSAAQSRRVLAFPCNEGADHD